MVRPRAWALDQSGLDCPGPGRSAVTHRYSYTGGNPLVYTDPSGHFLHLVAGAVGGGLLTGVTYSINALRNDSFDLGDLAVAAGAGAAGGALIATGVGAGAGASIMAGVLAGAGAGALVSAEVHLVNNFVKDEAFDRTDFVVTTGFGAAEGATAALVGPLAGIGSSAAFAGAESAVTDLAHGQPVNWTDAGKEAFWGGVSGAVGEVARGRFDTPIGIPLGQRISTVDLKPLAWPLAPEIVSAASNAALLEAWRTLWRDLGYTTLSDWLGDEVLE